MQGRCKHRQAIPPLDICLGTYCLVRTAKYWYMPSNTGQSDSPGEPMLKRFNWIMYSCVVSGVTCFIKLM